MHGMAAGAPSEAWPQKKTFQQNSLARKLGQGSCPIWPSSFQLKLQPPSLMAQHMACKGPGGQAPRNEWQAQNKSPVGHLICDSWVAAVLSSRARTGAAHEWP
eukprot:scaffold13888_cov24-Tisochrysis_lutea.AAC.3